MNASWLLAPLLAMTLGAAPSRAAEDAEAELRACRAERDDARRLACYDREMDRFGGTATAGPIAPAPSPAPLSAEERFGRQGALIRDEIERKQEETRELGELRASVTEIQTRSDGLMFVTLDNGQVWKQNRPDSFFRLKVGDAVKIQPAALNSFLMSGPSKNSTRVSRIR